MKTVKKTREETFPARGEIPPDDLSKTVKTGFRRLDEFLRGMDNGSLTVISAERPSDGIAFALNVVGNLLNHTPCPEICFASQLDSTELISRLMHIICGVPTHCNDCVAGAEEDPMRLMRCGPLITEGPLFFIDFRKTGGIFRCNFDTLLSGDGPKLLIADNVRLRDCRHLKELALEKGIAVLALTTARDKASCEELADTVLALSCDRHAPDPDLGIPVELTVSKNAHGAPGVCFMYLIPEIMTFKESCRGETVFVAIPETYEPVTPYGELKKYLAPENLPLQKHLHAEVPKPREPLNLSDMLSLSARLEAVGDHATAVKVFLMGRNSCVTYERGAEVCYDWMFAAMYYWLFRDMTNARRCMERAKAMLDAGTKKEYDELERRLRTYRPAEWIKEEEIC